MSNFLEVYGAKIHNLKNIDVKIPKNKLVVITGLSGSGKSSLAFSTIYSEGKNRYLESLSNYAKMFIGGSAEETKVDEIKGLSPTISIDQKTVSRNPRSTVGTITEIYDYYKLLFLHLGDRKCVKCGNIIKKNKLSDILLDLKTQEKGKRFIIKSNIIKKEKGLTYRDIKNKVLNLGFIRFSIDGNIYSINEEVKIDIKKEYNVDIIVDRLVVKDFSDPESNDTKRLKDSLELAFKVGEGFLAIDLYLDKIITNKYSNIFVCSDCGHIPEELTISSFSFNSHAGACPECHGLGEKMVFLEENLVNENLTIEEGAIIAIGFGSFFSSLIKIVAKEYKFKINIPYREYPKKIRDIIMYGTGEKKYKVNYKSSDGEFNTYNSRHEGVINTMTRRFFEGVGKNEKLSDYATNITCPECNGFRLNKEVLNIYLDGISIGEMSEKSVEDALLFIEKLSLTKGEKKISENIVKNIKERLTFLSGVGLSYMTISRKANTLSGGEAQRIRLATQIGTNLEGIIYVLDEPSIGLHPRDNNMLIDNLKRLRDLGNTLIVVEHDEDIMREADYIIDVGPGAGIHGGKIIAQGTMQDIIKNPQSLTGTYLKKGESIKITKTPRKISKYLDIIGAAHHNLKNIDVSIPLGTLTVVTGVSGSGKSSLVNDILANHLLNTLNRAKRDVGIVKEIKGTENLDKALVIDQSPIGKTPRSNPATYTGVFTHIRDIFAKTEEALIRGYDMGRFSFNTKGGRCESCDGDGVKRIEMHFLPPVFVKCESCDGKRFNKETLSITYKGKTISDVLDMTVEEALEFFGAHSKIKKVLNILFDIGLGYIKLGQPSTTLSGGEAQRIKLATELSKRSTSKTFYILDEPTTGLHFQDVEKLLKILNLLVEKGNSVLIIEHNMNVIVNADYIIDIGPEGGKKGGKLLVSGNIDEIIKCKKSYTGKAIKEYLKK